jgi:hypothetical protein
MIDASFMATVDLMNDRLEQLVRKIDFMAKREDLTTRILRLPVGLREDQAYCIVGGPAQGRQWHIRRAFIDGPLVTYPVHLFSDESLSLASSLWVFESYPLQETWSHEEMVLFHPDVLVVGTGDAFHDVLGGQIQVVDKPLYGARSDFLPSA